MVKRMWVWSLAFHLLAGLFSSGFQNHDEHFRIAELTYFKMGRAPEQEQVDEYHDKKLPFLAPGICYVIASAVNRLGMTDGFVWATCFRLFSALMGWLSLIYFSIQGLPLLFSDTRTQRVGQWLLCFFWLLPFLHARTDPGNWGGIFLLFSITSLCLLVERPFCQPLLASMTGILFAVTFSCRYQTGVSLMFVGLWTVIFRPKQVRRHLLWLILGLGLGLIFAEIINYWGYGGWYFTQWNYFKDAFVRQRIMLELPSPYYYYFRETFLKGGLPFSILLIIGVVLSPIFFFRHILTWAMIPYLLVHQYMAHKQTNYLFPIVVPALLLSVPFAITIYDRLLLLVPRLTFWLRSSNVGINFVFLAITVLTPAEPAMGFFSFLNTRSKRGPVRVWSVDGDPYRLVGIPINIYRPSNLSIESFSNYSLLESAIELHPVLVIVRSFHLPPQEEKLRGRCQRIYSPFPTFVAWWNFNNWIERTRLWSVYQCGRANYS